jgi:23S rRNA (guanosine2251-2'-O)-methyltransferase
VPRAARHRSTRNESTHHSTPNTQHPGCPLVKVYGINPVLEALRAQRVTAVRVSGRGDDRIAEIVRLAEGSGIAVVRVNPGELNRAAGGSQHRHQGVVADVRGSESVSVEDLVTGAVGAPLIVVLDGIEDPHNLGAILRSVDAAGADGVVRQSRHAARVDGAAAKASAGAVSHVKIAEVVNIARAVEILKDAGVWTVGLVGDAPKQYDQVDFTMPTALIVGAEGVGLRRLVRERCDWLVSIPMAGHVQSLNVSVATGIALFEAVRQRNRSHG